MLEFDNKTKSEISFYEIVDLYLATLVNLCITLTINNDPSGICRMNINGVMPQIKCKDAQARFMFITLRTQIQDTSLTLTELPLGT